MTININTLNGRYRAVAVDGGLGETSGGKEQVAALFKLTDEGETKGVQLTWYGYFTDGTVDSTIKALRAMGWKGNDLSELLDFKKAIPTPEECELVIEPEPQTDSQQNPIFEEDGVTQKVRARVRWVNPVGKVGIKTALTPDKAAAFAARMKGKLLSFDQQNGAPKNNGAPGTPPPRQSPPAPAKDPGDVPF
jgi:hypothetical protein